MGYKGEYMKLRAQVLREEPFCRVCGRPSETVDHIIPKAWGGTDDRNNLQGLCKRCHNKKTRQESIKGKKGQRG